MRELQEDIILAFQQGERTAFQAVYKHFYPSIVTFCKYFLSVEEAEDTAADIFIRLWQSHGKWDSIRNVRAFLLMCARNACLEEREKEIAFLKTRDQELFLKADIESDLVARLRQEINNLPDNCKTVLTLSMEGYKTPEIAVKMSIQEQSVKNIKSKALKIIRTSLLKRNLQINMVAIVLHFLKDLD
jgi:RNA polymerase sigma factor (sigma-70 family)